MNFMEIEVSLSSMAAFQFSEFHENEAKHDKLNFKKGLTVTFEI